MSNPFSVWGTMIDENREHVSRYPDPEWYPAFILKIPERELMHNHGLIRT